MRSRRRRAPVSVWVAQAQDVMDSQRVARLLGKSLGLDGEDIFLSQAETAEKGGALLATAAGSGWLVFTPRRSAAGPGLRVEARAATAPDDPAGVIGVAPALFSGGGPIGAGPLREPCFAA